MGRGGTFVRFFVVNAVNTVLYWALYLVLLLALPYLWANALALVVAVLAAYVMNVRYAFRVRASARSLVLFLVTNGMTILLRMVVVWVLVEQLTVSAALAPPIGVAVTMPIAFVLTKLVVAERSPRPRHRLPAVTPA